VSNAKFAPMTADLLVRKGEAAPSLATKRIFDWSREPAPASLREEPEEWIEEPTIDPPPYPDGSHESLGVPDARKARRIMVSFSATEFERLGIAAAKRGMTRHELVQATLRSYLRQLARELNGTCACLALGEEAACRAFTCSGSKPSS
jgi:hypothetical protein